MPGEMPDVQSTSRHRRALLSSALGDIAHVVGGWARSWTKTRRRCTAAQLGRQPVEESFLSPLSFPLGIFQFEGHMMLRTMRGAPKASARATGQAAPGAVARPSAHHVRQNAASPIAQQRFLGGLVAPVSARRAQFLLGAAVAVESPAAVASKVVFDKK